jgi:hypothetical protein
MEIIVKNAQRAVKGNMIYINPEKEWKLFSGDWPVLGRDKFLFIIFKISYLIIDNCAALFLLKNFYFSKITPRNMIYD